MIAVRTPKALRTFQNQSSIPRGVTRRRAGDLQGLWPLGVWGGRCVQQKRRSGTFNTTSTPQSFRRRRSHVSIRVVKGIVKELKPDFDRKLSSSALNVLTEATPLSESKLWLQMALELMRIGQDKVKTRKASAALQPPTGALNRPDAKSKMLVVEVAFDGVSFMKSVDREKHPSINWVTLMGFHNVNSALKRKDVLNTAWMS